jgi:myo-inositol-1(or 4)-monophosphatase
MRIYSQNFSVTYKSPQDPVTEADLQIHHFLKENLASLTPDIPLLSEESEVHLSHSKGLAWILDPIDGTREFVSKNPEFAISLGLTQDGIPQFGMVINPPKGEIFFGESQTTMKYGTFSPQSSESGWKITNTPPKEKNVKVYVSRTEMKEGKINKEIFPLDWKIESMGSIAYKLALLAGNFCQMVVSFNPKNVWDIAGGASLCKSQGIEIYSLDTREKINVLDKVEKGILCGKYEDIQLLLNRL